MSLIDLLHSGSPVPFDAIDMHAHLGRFSHAIPSLDPATIVAVMDRMGVKSTVVSHLQCISWDVTWGNAVVLDAMRRFPGRILGYASLFPKDAAFVEQTCTQCVADGFTGFKLHVSNGFQYDDPAYEPAWSVAEAHHLPVLFHTWGDAAQLNSIVQAAHKAPHAYFLLGHSGSSMPQLYLDAAAQAPNIRLELCTSACTLGLIERLAAAVGANRILWGSDCLFYSMAQQFGRLLGCKLDDASKQMILSTNALELLAERR